METKYEVMGDRIFLLVPVFDERLKDCPLDSVGALVYAYLLFRVRNKKPDRQFTSRTEIALSLRLDSQAVSNAVRILIEEGLVREQGNRLQAVKPGQGSRDWFRHRDCHEGEWNEGFVYDRVFLPSSSTTLSVKTNHLFWHLVRISYPVARMPGYHMVGGHPNNPPKYLTLKYLARGLNCCPRTVARGLKRLERLKLIKIQQWGRNKFVVGIPPIGDGSKLWRNDWKRGRREVEPPPEITAESLFAVPSRDDLMPAEENQTELGLFATSYGIHGKILEEIITQVVKHRVPPIEWKPLLKLAAKIHASNMEKDPNQYPTRHCGRLFKSMLADLIAKLAAKNQIMSHAPGKSKSLSEINSRQLIFDLGATIEATRLLEQAVTADQLPLKSGGCIPCQLHWEEVEKIAISARKDYGKFRDGIVSHIFGQSEQTSECPWYVAWVREEPIPEWDESALRERGVPRWAISEVQTHAEELVGQMSGWSDDIKTRKLANLLIKYGCKEAAGPSLEEVRQGMTAAFHRIMPEIGRAADAESMGSQGVALVP